MRRGPPFGTRCTRATRRADRPAPTPLTEQIRRLSDVLEAFGFPVFKSPGFEADDVLATLAR